MRKKLYLSNRNVFRHARFFEAREDADTNTGGGGSGTEDGNEEGEEGGSEPTYEDLLEQLAAERAEKLKLKNEKNVASTEAANWKKKFRETLSKDQQEAEEERINREAEKKELADLKAWKRLSEAIARYKVLDMDDKTAKEVAQAEVDGDFEKITSIFEKHIKAIKAAAYQQFLADRPDIAAGSGEADRNTKADEIAVSLAKKSSGNRQTSILEHYRR